MDIKRDLAHIMCPILKDSPYKNKVLMWENKNETEQRIVIIYNNRTYQDAIHMANLITPSVDNDEKFKSVSIMIIHERDADEWIVLD